MQLCYEELEARQNKLLETLNSYRVVHDDMDEESKNLKRKLAATENHVEEVHEASKMGLSELNFALMREEDGKAEHYCLPNEVDRHYRNRIQHLEAHNDQLFSKISDLEKQMQKDELSFMNKMNELRAKIFDAPRVPDNSICRRWKELGALIFRFCLHLYLGRLWSGEASNHPRLVSFFTCALIDSREGTLTKVNCRACTQHLQ